MLEHIIYGIRILNTILALILFAMLVSHWMNVKHMDTSRRWGYIAFSSYVFATAYYSAETYAEHVQIGARSFFFLIANIITFYAFWKHRQIFGTDQELLENLDERLRKEQTNDGV